MNSVFAFDVERGGETAWRRGNEGTIATVRRMMRKNNVLFTRYAKKLYGGFYDQLPLTKGNGQASLKPSDPRMTVERFGGYNKVSGSYFCLVEHTVKKERIRSLETVYLMSEKMYLSDPARYCREVLGLKDAKILIPCIRINSLVSFNGFRMHVSGRSESRIIYKNANPLVLDISWHQYVKDVVKFAERTSKDKLNVKPTVFDGVTAEKNLELYDLLKAKLQVRPFVSMYDTSVKRLEEGRDTFIRLPEADQCRTLMQVLHLFENNAMTADLKLLCGKAGIGLLRTSKNLDNYAGVSFKLIQQSVTGFFEQEVDLLSCGAEA